MAAASKRSEYFDNAKFILIFLVVFGHVISPLKEYNKVLYTLYTFIYLFHMPAFIMISGYFAKNFKKKGYLVKTFKKILVPYFIFQVIYSVFYYAIGKESTIHFDILEPHWSLWFLLSMFFWNVFLYLFSKMGWAGFFVSAGIGIAVGYIDDIGSFMSLSRTFVFFPYFFIGYLLKGNQLQRLVRNRYSLPIGIVIILATVICFAIGIPETAVPWLLGDTSYAGMGGEQLFDGVLRASQYAATLIVTYGFLTLIPSSKLKLTKIGERTLYVYLFHGFIIKPVQTILPKESLNVVSENYWIPIIFSFVVCTILGSYLVKKYTKPLVEPKLPLGSGGS
ncbi:acyltransferase family protein [Neobacillus muris]|uniref:acyltransferase family protein n=1 Tax=Neobacillus muris TaxID=2941334 RepID=UPI00203C6BB4|nr:acyltransferase family protein [Neobacillus muris]